MLCPNCKTENRDGAKFCDECGTPLGGVDETARMPQTPDDATDSEEPKSVADTGKHARQEIVAESKPADEDSDSAALEQGEEQVSENAEAPEPATPDVTELSGETQAIKPEDDMLSDSDVASAAEGDITGYINLDGIDQEGDLYGERIVSADYSPEPNFRDGQTMQMPRVEGEEAPKSRDFLASSTTKQNKSKKIIIGIIAAIVVIAAIAAVATYQMQLWGGKVVPDVRGMTEADATGVLEEHGFTVRSTQVKSDDTEGLVLIMDPAEGARADEGSEVVIHIATTRAIPAIIGKPEAEAKAALEEEGYENVTFNKERSDEPEGNVLSVSPEVGARAKSSIGVVVKVAEPYVVPDIANLTYNEAVSAIQDAGLRYDVYYVDTEMYVDGSIIGSEPAAGEKVKSDTVVVIDIARARGAQLVALAQSALAPGTGVNIGNNSYEIQSIDHCQYIGNNTVEFSVTARPYTYILGEYVYISSRSVSGTVVFNDNNEVVSIS